MKYNCIVVLGPTASGKTKLACQLASSLNGEIIGVDSRQVYKHLNIGTGKDLEEYEIDGKQIPYHLIDICEPERQFYLHDFVSNAKQAFLSIVEKSHLPIFCGGTGLYLDSLRKQFPLTQYKPNESLRAELDSLDKSTLLQRLKKYPEKLTSHIDKNSTKRIIRGIEIAEQILENGFSETKQEIIYKPLYIGIKSATIERRNKISQRLKSRFENGLVEEVEGLLKNGITHERLQFLGLEYKYLSLFLQNELSKEECFKKLETAIHQYAKRQMTWFRKMEKEAVDINWVDSENSLNGFGKLHLPGF